MKRKKRWIISKGDKDAEETLIKHFSIDPIVARILVNRGVTTTGQADSFFKAPLDELLDPMLMASMPEAVDRILSAKDNKEKIVVFGQSDRTLGTNQIRVTLHCNVQWNGSTNVT